LDVHVKRLRQKLEVDPARPKHIVTVRGLGYKFVDE
ncbi:MAG: winged helix-turn-helix domain-containing protein, partial [Acidimicrobiia bacterium]